MNSSCTLYVPKGSLEAYQEAKGWKDFENIVEYEQEEDVNVFEIDGVCYTITSESDLLCSVAKGAEDYSGDVVIPSTVNYDGQTYTVTTISSNAFYNCTELTSISIPRTITQIEKSAFSGCTGLTKVNIEDLSAWCNINNGYVGSEEMYVSNPLQYAKNLYLNGELVTDLEIPMDVSRIPDCAFYGCKSLTSVVLPPTLQQIGGYAFYGCDNLKTVYNLTGLGSGSTSIKESDVTRYATNVYTNKYDVYDGKEEVAVKTDESQITKTSANALVFDLASSAVPTKENYVNYKNQAGKIALTDMQPFYCPEDVAVEKLTYTRSFSKSTWQPFYVPFSMKYDEWKDVANIAFINNVRQYDEDQDGVIERTVLEFITKNKGTINPNTPYLIQSLNPGSTPMVLECSNTTLKATPDTDPYISCASTTMTYKLSGTYQWLSDLSDRGSYVMNSGNFGPCAAGASLQPFRIYLDISAPEEYAGKTRAAGGIGNLGEIYISVDGELLETDEDFKQEFLNQNCFDLQGRKVKEATSPGLYVKNGKIIYIK